MHNALYKFRIENSVIGVTKAEALTPVTWETLLKSQI